MLIWTSFGLCMASDFLFVSNLLNYSSSYRFILIARIAWQTNSFIFLSENLGLFLWPFRSKTFFFVSVFMNRLAGEDSRGCLYWSVPLPPPPMVVLLDELNWLFLGIQSLDFGYWLFLANYWLMLRLALTLSCSWFFRFLGLHGTSIVWSQHWN